MKTTKCNECLKTPNPMRILCPTATGTGHGSVLGSVANAKVDEVLGQSASHDGDGPCKGDVADQSALDQFDLVTTGSASRQESRFPNDLVGL